MVVAVVALKCLKFPAFLFLALTISCVCHVDSPPRHEGRPSGSERDTGGGFKDPILTGIGREASGQVKSTQVKLCTRVDWPSGLHGGQPTSERSLVGGVDRSALRQRILYRQSRSTLHAGTCNKKERSGRGGRCESSRVPSERNECELHTGRFIVSGSPTIIKP